MHNLSYGGINSEDYKAYITNAGLYKSPGKRYKNYTVPGRNGKLLEDTGNFENVEVEYPMVVYENCDTNYQNFIAAMRRKKGYQRIEDTFHPEYYRMGAFVDELEPKEVTMDADKCSAILKFDCLPQKFLKSGENSLCILEGNFYNYVSSAEDPDIPSTAYMYTGYIDVPTNKTVNIKMHNECEDANVTIISYNSQSVEISTQYLVPEYEQWLPVGNYEVTITLPANTEKWAFVCIVTGTSIGEVVTVEDTWAEFTFSRSYFGETRNITALLKENVYINNPTGFATKPIIEYFAYYDSNIKITNIEDGEAKDFYELSFDVSDLTNKHIYLDCDQQYAYNSSGENVSNIMSIVTAERADGKSLVFPEFGGDVIKIEFLHNNESSVMTPHNTIIFITPRWWTV